MRVDRALIDRLERSEARAALATVAELRSQGGPDVAAGVELATGALVAMGPGRYLNRALGFGVADCTDAVVDELEAFYDARGLPPMLEVSSWAPSSTVERLGRRGYRAAWFRSMFAAVPTPTVREGSAVVRIGAVTAADRHDWLEVLAVGNGITAPDQRVVSDEFALANAAVADAVDLLARIGDHPVGCGSLQTVDGVGWIGGAATLPEWRGRGVQKALIDERIRIAATRGLGLVAATALPDGPSARNLRAAGFIHVQDQIVMVRPR